MRRAVLVMLLLLLSAAGCKKKLAGSSRVTVATATTEPVPIEIGSVGAAEASSSVSVRSRVAGELTKILFAEGQYVIAGQILFVVDPRPYEIAVQQAEARLLRDRAQAEAPADVVRADEVALENARLLVSHCLVRAPLSGIAGAVKLRSGAHVRAGDTVLVTVSRIQPMFVTFTAPSPRLDAIRAALARRALSVQAAPPNDAGKPEQGVISFVGDTVDRATGAVRLRGTFDNTEGRLRPGQLVRVAMRLATRPSTVVVPSAAVQRGESGSFVMVIAPDLTASRRPVVVAPSPSAGKLVVERGLEAGERVVTDGQLRVVSGGKVAIVNEQDAWTH